MREIVVPQNTYEGMMSAPSAFDMIESKEKFALIEERLGEFEEGQKFLDKLKGLPFFEEVMNDDTDEKTRKMEQEGASFDEILEMQRNQPTEEMSGAEYEQWEAIAEDMRDLRKAWEEDTILQNMELKSQSEDKAKGKAKGKGETDDKGGWEPVPNNNKKERKKKPSGGYSYRVKKAAEDVIGEKIFYDMIASRIYKDLT
jgi:hypothetical protein